MTSEERFVGQRVTRREDKALLTGRATFTDDVTTSETVHLGFVRSQHGHADVTDIDTSSAETQDDVIATYTWADIAESDSPGIISARTEHLDAEVPGHPILAMDRVRYQGQPIAAVVAEDRYTARAACRQVEVSYERLPAVTDPGEAPTTEAPTLFEAAPDNVAVVARSERRRLPRPRSRKPTTRYR
jgi:carbon-monoxide dehydrogenase large subunit